eukprot:scaffold3046_cov105-Cylindrotheca_fusiformis.AAC.25
MMCKTALRGHGRDRLRTALLGVASIGRSRNQLVDHTTIARAKSDSTHLTQCDMVARADLHALACWDLSPPSICWMFTNLSVWPKFLPNSTVASWILYPKRDETWFAIINLRTLSIVWGLQSHFSRSSFMFQVF